MSASRFIAHARRAPLVLAFSFLLVVSCDPKEADKILFEYYKETVVIPNGSTIVTRYWRLSPITFGARQIDADELPEGRTFIPITTTVGAAPGSLIAGPSASQVADNTAIVALFAGGRGTGNVVASDRAALFDETGTMVTGLHMTTARTENGMSELPGGRVLISGGFAANSSVLNSAEVFTLATRTFAATSNMRIPRANPSMTLLPDGRVFVAGGLVPVGSGPATDYSATTEFYNAATGAFSDGPSMITPRATHTAILLDDGRVLILGGIVGRDAEVFNPATNTFAAVGQTHTIHANGHTAVKLTSGKVLILGGDGTGHIQPTAAAELFDPATNTFTLVGVMTTPRMQHFAVVLDDGRVYVGGGRTTGGDPLKSAEVFDPATNAFTRVADLPGETYDQAAVFVQGRAKRD